ncbi:MAG TPA: 2-methylcitrate dehydratase, partial [Burkholderiales bacterium]|nr:2-methylcitrate dehydratase [Burkholderiales bacterium]
GLVEHDNPLGHPSRRTEGIPRIITKLSARLEKYYPPRQQRQILELCLDQRRFLEATVPDFTDCLAR